MLFERNMLPYRLDYKIIDNDNEVIKLSGKEELDFMNEVRTNAIILDKNVINIIRKALEDDSIIVIMHKEKYGVNTLYILEDSNKKVYII